MPLCASLRISSKQYIQIKIVSINNKSQKYEPFDGNNMWVRFLFECLFNSFILYNLFRFEHISSLSKDDGTGVISKTCMLNGVTFFDKNFSLKSDFAGLPSMANIVAKTQMIANFSLCAQNAIFLIIKTLYSAEF